MTTDSKGKWNPDILLQRLISAGGFVWQAGREIWYGSKFGTLPLGRCFFWGSLMCAGIIFGFDAMIFRRLGIMRLYPTSRNLFGIYSIVVETSGFWLWSLYQMGLKARMLRRLKDILLEAKLKTVTDKLPGFVFDRAIDDEARILRVTRSGIPAEKFVDAKNYFESGLKIFVDSIEENREAGTIDIHYAHRPLATVIEFGTVGDIPRESILIGMARSQKIVAALNDVPHFLVAGETSSGKSSFLRQVITTLYKNNPGYHFTLVDLKGGLEFSRFSGLERVDVVSTLESAAIKLLGLSHELDSRMQALQQAGAKDLLEYRAKNKGNTTAFGRHIIVIDEIAELFLTNRAGQNQDIKNAREAVSKIARQGRALGQHLIIGTQRPDARALDTQIRANLPGKVCFQMADMTSSVIVLNNTRARDLPGIPGRAIWQRGLTNSEVQTPFLTPEATATMLGISATDQTPTPTVSVSKPEAESSRVMERAA